MKRSSPAVLRQPGLLAAGLCTLSIIGFGAALDGYSQLQHPVALLGALGVPRAAGFNLLALVAPGLLGAWAFARARTQLPDDAGWSARIGARLLMLSALAFALQGIAPLDPEDLDGAAGQRHATAWTLWWIAAGAGAVLTWAGLPGRPGWRRLAWCALLASAVIVVLSALPPAWVPSAIAQRLALAAWLGLLVWSGGASARDGDLSRGAASSPGSSPTART